jgi:uncharacterized membrane protein (UPF0127 family)
MNYMKKIVFFILCIIAGLIVALMLKVYFNQPQITDHGLLAISLGQKNLTVEIVNTAASITQGLSGREQIGSDGMLFLLPQTTIPTFWMKEMKFDLDFIWLKNNQVVDITRDVPHPDPETPLTALPIYSPPGPINMVLEVNAGQAAVWKIEPGDKLSFH